MSAASRPHYRPPPPAAPGRPRAHGSGRRLWRHRVRLLGWLLLVAALLPVFPALAFPSPATGATTATPISPASAAGDEEARATVQAWVDGEGLQLVRQRAGAQATIALGSPTQIRSWAPAFLEGRDTAAAPVLTGDWAVPVRVDDTAHGVLIVTVSATGATGSLNADPELAAAVWQDKGAGFLVRDDGAWYLVKDSTVSAINAEARAGLAGTVSTQVFSVVLRERTGTLRTETATDKDGLSLGDVPVWAVALAVVTLGVVCLTATILHERRVTEPLRRVNVSAPGKRRQDRQSANRATHQTQPERPRPLEATLQLENTLDAARIPRPSASKVRRYSRGSWGKA